MQLLPVGSQRAGSRRYSRTLICSPSAEYLAVNLFKQHADALYFNRLVVEFLWHIVKLLQRLRTSFFYAGRLCILWPCVFFVLMNAIGASSTVQCITLSMYI